MRNGRSVLCVHDFHSSSTIRAKVAKFPARLSNKKRNNPRLRFFTRNRELFLFLLDLVHMVNLSFLVYPLPWTIHHFLSFSLSEITSCSSSKRWWSWLFSLRHRVWAYSRSFLYIHYFSFSGSASSLKKFLFTFSSVCTTFLFSDYILTQIFINFNWKKSKKILHFFRQKRDFSGSTKISLYKPNTFVIW